MGNALTRDQILGRGCKSKSVPVPEWEGDVLIRRISGAERDRVIEVSEADKAAGKFTGFTTLLVSLSICDEAGKPMFTQDEVRQKLDAIVVDALFREAAKYNGISKTEELEKNSASGPSAASGSV